MFRDDVIRCHLCREPLRVMDLGGHLEGHIPNSLWRCGACSFSAGRSAVAAHCILARHPADSLHPPTTDQAWKLALAEVQRVQKMLHPDNSPATGPTPFLNMNQATVNRQTTSPAFMEAEGPSFRETCSDQVKTPFLLEANESGCQRYQDMTEESEEESSIYIPEDDSVSYRQVVEHSELSHERSSERPEQGLPVEEECKPLTCVKCSSIVRFTGVKDFLNHITSRSHSKSNEKAWRCNLCQQTRRNAKELSLHLRKSHQMPTMRERECHMEFIKDSDKTAMDLEQSFPSLPDIRPKFLKYISLYLSSSLTQ